MKPIDKIEAIQQEAEAAHWPYPTIFEALKAIGVDSYIVKLENPIETIFNGKFGQCKQIEDRKYSTLEISEKFSSLQVKEALIDHTQGKTNYIEFLEAMAKAGVSHYKVNMHTREIYYYSLKETDYHKEVVPKRD